MKLPTPYLERMKKLLGDTYDSFMDSMNQTVYYGLRVNTLKISTEDFIKQSPFEIKQVPWIDNGFYYHKKEQPSKHSYYHAGLYYLQEPSAMTPASCMPINEGDKVLDLCAAPGGKSTELGTRLNQSGILVSNDISPSRTKGLLKNIELFGITNSVIMSESPAKLTHYFPEYYDKILVDAPCSGEGMFRKDPSMVKGWDQNKIIHYTSLQKDILSSAAKMLKQGGLLLYSTCTFSPEENEGTIDSFLNHHAEFELVELPFFEGSSRGHTEWVNAKHDMSKAMRLWPHKIQGEGHFIALLRKKGISSSGILHNNRRVLNKKVLEPYLDFEKNYLKFQLDISRLELKNNKLIYMPKEIPELKGLRLLRTGWYIGEIKQNRFEPSQALAMGIKKEQVIHSIDLSVEDVQVIKYLKGETLNIKVPKGYYLVCTDGYPLGWAKSNQQLLKNKYYSGWRRLH